MGPLARSVGGGLAAGQRNVDGRAAGNVFSRIEVAIIEHQNFVGRRCAAHRRAHEDASLLGVDRNPQRVAVLPIDLIPGGLNFLRDFYGLATVEDVEAGAVRDHYPIFAEADATDRRRAQASRNFRDGPQRGLIGAIVLRGVQRMLLHEVKALAQLERRANGLAVVFGDAQQAVDAVVAFGIFDAAGAHQRSVQRLRGGENFNAIEVELSVLFWCSVRVNAQDEVARNRGERRGELRGEFGVAGGELRGS